jgi:hypothetical protein
MFLGLAKAMATIFNALKRESLEIEFMKDLERWQLLFNHINVVFAMECESGNCIHRISPSRSDFCLGVRQIWGVKIPCILHSYWGILGVLEEFKHLALTLENQFNSLLPGWIEDGSSLGEVQNRWQEQRQENRPMSMTHELEIRHSHNSTDFSLVGGRGTARIKEDHNFKLKSEEDCLRESMRRNEETPEDASVITVLMAGTIFTIVFLFLLCKSSNIN